MNRSARFIAIVAGLVLLAACGGGGGGGDTSNAPPPPPPPDPVTTVTLSTDTITRSAGLTDPAPREAIRATVTNMPETGLYVGWEYSGTAVSNIEIAVISETVADLVVDLHEPSAMSAGTYTDQITFYFCFDIDCFELIEDGTKTVAVNYTVTESVPVPEPGLEPAPVASRSGLAHDVIDAEYSAALDAIVMVSAYPANALYLFDVASGTERQLALDKTPTAVSVAPDGLTAAVGHDALVTHVDLAQLAATGATDVKLLDISTEAFDLVLDGRGFVHVMPAADQWVDFHSVEVATNVETTVYVSLYAQTRARLHPSGDFLYTANNGLSPSDIAKFDVTSVPVTALGDSPYHGDYEMCGNLWFNESGITIYTACGNTFRASTVQEQDMVYSGALQLSNDDVNFGFIIDSLSESAEAGEIALIESTRYECQFQPNSCRSRLSLYENAFLNRNHVYSLPPIEVAGHPYAQSGLFVFHSADGSERLLISRLRAMPNPKAEYYISYTE